MSFRDALLSAGLKPRDIREAVKQARQTAHTAATWARYAEGFLTTAEMKVTGRTHQAIVLAGKVARVVREVAEETLRKR